MKRGREYSTGWDERDSLVFKLAVQFGQSEGLAA